MDFDFRNFEAPYLDKTFIREQAEAFRKRNWSAGNLPVNILGIVEFDLRLEIRPIKGLRPECDTDALLLGNRKTIIVDYDYYMEDRMQNRLRFSVAHEVGHHVLHNDVFQKLKHNSVEEWIEFMTKVPENQYRYIEYHANEFAGRLLVPLDILKKKLEDALALAKSKRLSNEYLIGGAALEHISSVICRPFGVSHRVIQRRLQIENLWPPKHF